MSQNPMTRNEAILQAMRLARNRIVTTLAGIGVVEDQVKGSADLLGFEAARDQLTQVETHLEAARVIINQAYMLVFNEIGERQQITLFEASEGGSDE